MNSNLSIIKKTILDNLKSISSLIYFGLSIIFLILIMLNFKFFSDASLLKNIFSFNETIYLWGFLVFSGLTYFIYVLYITISNLSKDLNDGVALLIFTRPISRFNYIISKFIGLFLYFMILELVIGLFAKFICNLYVFNPIMIQNLNIILLSFFSVIVSYSILLTALAFLFFFIFRKSILAITLSIVFSLILWIYPLVLRIIFGVISPNLISPIINSTFKVLITNKIFFVKYDIFNMFINTLSNIGYGYQEIIYFSYSLNWFFWLITFSIISSILIFVSYMLFKKQDIL